MLQSSRILEFPMTIGHIETLVGEKKKEAIYAYLEQNKKLPLAKLAIALNVSVTYLTVIQSIYRQKYEKEKQLKKKTKPPVIETERRHVGRAPIKSDVQLSAYEKRLRRVTMIIDSLIENGVCHCGTLATYAQTNITFVKQYIHTNKPSKKDLSFRQFSHLSAIASRRLKDGEPITQVARATGLHPLCIENIKRYGVPNFVGKILPEVDKLLASGANAQVVGQKYGLPGSVITNYYKRLRRASSGMA